MVVIAIAVSMLISAATGIPSRSAFSVAFVAVFVPMIVIPLLDRRLAGKLNPNGLAHRVFARVAGAGLLLSPLRFIGPIQFVFQSRLGQRKLGIALGMASAVIMASLLVSVFLRSGELRLDGWTYFDPRPTAASIDPGHYRDSGASRTGRRPTIDSDVIASSCKVLAAAVAAGSGLNNAMAATCLGNLYKVSLDGAAVTASYSFTRDAASEFVGVLAYLPTAGMASGPHELTIDGPGGNPDAPREIIKIPFYSVAK
jgi:hypothetical protein